MDNVYKFHAKGQVGHLKSIISSEQKLQFYSEEENASSQDLTPQSKDDKKCNQKSGFINLQQGYQTDDSEAGTPLALKQSSANNVKMSKFRTLLNSKQIEGDVENEPTFSDSEVNNLIEIPNPVQTEYDYNIEEQAQKVQQKHLEKTKLKGPKNHSQSTRALVVHSDVEKKNGNSKGQKTKDSLSDHPFRHLIFGPSISEANFKKYLILTQRGLIYAKKCLKGPSDKFIKSKQVFLPEQKQQKDKTLVLDLDETLIHSCPARDNPQVYVTAVGDHGEEAKIGLNVRPYLTYFLSTLSKIYTIYIFTASSPAYASAIINYIDPKREYIQGVLTRGNCMETKNGFFIKDLRIIANKNLKDMIIIDNLAHSFGFQIENGIPILEWHNDANDQELKYLTDFLLDAVNHNDLRAFIKQLKLDELVEFIINE